MTEKNPLVELATEAIKNYVYYKKKLDSPDNLSSEMKKRCGVFVSIKKKGQLRGCIGTFQPTTANVACEIINNAIAAASEDPRFNPIISEELEDLEISVDVLSPPEKINSKLELDPKRYGVIVQKGFRRGLLLPDLEGVDTVDYQLSIAKAKAGIKEEEDVQLYRFEVKRYK
ncbi:MAG: AmmeMemoRadiSam system protein A [bacterium]|nr:AmmeMemoRadiSam system protein A [bacterium]